MMLLVTICMIGLVYSDPLPGFRYAYMVPQSGGNQPLSQFSERTGDSYAWGYEYPGQVHFESKNTQGHVTGSFGFYDANGSPIVWKYNSHPVKGFTVDIGKGFATDIGKGQPFPQAAPGEEIVEPVAYRAEEEAQSFEQRFQPSDDSLSPLLKKAVSTHELFPVGGSPFGLRQYAVNPEVADEEKSVSALAYRYGAIPVAAVHDVQSRPTFSDAVPDSAFAPVLVHHDQPDVTLYSLAVFNQ